MSNKFLAYLEREHHRLEQVVAAETRKLRPDTAELMRLKKLKLAIKDQIAGWRSEADTYVTQ